VVNSEAKNDVNPAVIACHFATEIIYTYIYSTCNKQVFIFCTTGLWILNQLACMFARCCFFGFRLPLIQYLKTQTLLLFCYTNSVADN
jgi:hypothetical protein